MPKARRKPAALPQVEPPQKPTAEAQRHGEYVQGNMGARAVWTNRRPCMILALHGSGSLSMRQAAAGLCFIETYHAVWGSPSRRDCTQPVLGGEVHETEKQAERWAAANARTNTILNRVGAAAYSQLVSVAVFDEPIGTYRAAKDAHEMLRGTLDQCAIAYGIQGT